MTHNTMKIVSTVVSLFLLSAGGLLQGEASGAQEPCEGFTLFSPIASTTTYLIDNDGQVVHTWPSSYNPGQAVYLLDSGDILRTLHDSAGPGGSGGGVERIDWNGDLVWQFFYSDSDHLHHHDIEPLPNGNVLLIAWEYKTHTEAVAAGRNPALLKPGPFYSEEIVEVKPIGSDSGEIVWEWHLWDHLIQDYDSNQANHGVVEDHPERMDINFPYQKADDWIHLNAVDYNPDLDQIMVSSRSLSEIWVIDHSTTTAEAAGHTGGNGGKGGDFLYRWGNAQSYRAGGASDQRLFGQHDAQWIGPGRPGEGHILIFNNGSQRPGGNYSSVEEIAPPVDAAGNYSLTPGSAYGPSDAMWSYTAVDPYSFYADHISGAERLPNGNTLICNGPAGYFFEVDEEMETVWDYTNPYPGGMNNEVFKVRRYAHFLWSDAHTLSAGSGGAITFSLVADRGNANRNYLLVGGITGTEPGLGLPGGLVTLPIVWDVFSDLEMDLLGTPYFQDFLGVLDGFGNGNAQLVVPPIPDAAGLTLYFAYCCNQPFDFVSNPLEIEVGS